MRLTTFAAGILILGLGSFPALNAVGSASDGQSATQQQAPPQVQQPLNVQVTVVNVFATVRDKHHAIISELTKDDFKILEDGAEQKVAFFSKELELPITLGLLVDTSGSMTRLLPAEQDAAARFLHQVMRRKDEAMVMSFDLDVNLLADFTQDTTVLERAIRRTVINSAGGGTSINTGPISQPNLGGTHLYDAVYLACHDQLVSEAGRKAIILLTDAVDEGSQLSVKDAIEAAQRTDAVIHVLLLSDQAFGGFGIGNPGPSVARKMSEETGGRVIDVHNEKTLEKAFDEISSELRSQYVLGYYPTNAKRDGTFRKIQVELPTHPDTKILARKGYYAPKG